MLVFSYYLYPASFCRVKSHCEVSNALKKWHIAYHGTNVGALRRTLDHGQLLPGTTLIFFAMSRCDVCVYTVFFLRNRFCLASLCRDVVHFPGVSSEDGGSKRLHRTRGEQRPRQGGSQSAALPDHALLWHGDVCSQSAVSLWRARKRRDGRNLCRK